MWLNMCADVGWASPSVAGPLAHEAEQQRKIFTASPITAKRRRRGGNNPGSSMIRLFAKRQSSIIAVERFALTRQMPRSAVINQHFDRHD
jgi:hypothetical protein